MTASDANNTRPPDTPKEPRHPPKTRRPAAALAGGGLPGDPLATRSGCRAAAPRPRVFSPDRRLRAHIHICAEQRAKASAAEAKDDRTRAAALLEERNKDAELAARCETSTLSGIYDLWLHEFLARTSAFVAAPA